MRTPERFVQTLITLRVSYRPDGNNLQKELPQGGSWHGAAVTEGVQKNADRGVNPCRRGIYQSSMMLLPVISFGTGSPM